MNNGSGYGAVIVFVICIVLMFGGCAAACSGGSSHNTYKPGTIEYENSMYMGRHGYFD